MSAGRYSERSRFCPRRRGVAQQLPHMVALLTHARPAAPDYNDGQYEPDRHDPEQGIVRHSAAEPFLNHLIRPVQQRRRDRQAKGLGGEIDDQRAGKSIGAGRAPYPPTLLSSIAASTPGPRSGYGRSRLTRAGRIASCPACSLDVT